MSVRVRKITPPPTQRVHALSITFDKGKLTQVTQGVTIAVLIRVVDHDGKPVDAEDVALAVKAPQQPAQTVEPVREAQGVYAHALQLSAGGSWQFRATTSGDCATACETQLHVKRSELA
ncbi:MAG TPA: FixH family protein [Solirubrobacteraceae bacterium]|jgi:nitrogen fixation protein FixH